mmetsp:Transcript_18608/g.42810  ORF Transcript_18608/g.42810 Transcript_18608/m.42810 type:complete len:285 (-) Transcript_18608:52-906(-)
MAPPVTPANGLIAPASVDSTLVNNPLLLNANVPLVSSTPFLQWQAYPPASPGGPARVGIPHSRAVKVFLRRCTLDQTQGNVGGFSNVDCFTFFLNAASWNRILNQMLQSNLMVAGPFATWPEFLFHLERLVPQKPDELELSSADLDLGESFDSAAVPGHPGTTATVTRRGSHGRARTQTIQATPAVPAQPAILGPPDIAFLALVKIEAMVDPTAGSPLGNWCDFIGALNASRTRTARLSPMADVRIAGVLLRGEVASRLMGVRRFAQLTTTTTHRGAHPSVVCG